MGPHERRISMVLHRCDLVGAAMEGSAAGPLSADASLKKARSRRSVSSRACALLRSGDALEELDGKGVEPLVEGMGSTTISCFQRHHPRILFQCLFRAYRIGDDRVPDGLCFLPPTELIQNVRV